jgi:Outer membrane protein beta-barrel domain
MKNLIFYILLLNLTLLVFNVNAQNVALGIRGGISIPNLSAGSGDQNPLNTGYSSRLGPDAGVFAEFKFSDLFSIQPMLEYSSQGGKKDGLQAFPAPAQVAQEFPAGMAPQYLYANFNSTAKLNYLMLPILAKFDWNFKSSPVRFYADAGPFLGYLLSAHQVTTGSSQFYTDPAGTQPLPGGAQSFDNTQDIKDQIHEFNLGFEANVGFAYKLKKSCVFIEGGGNYGFLNIQKGTANGKNNAGAGTVAVGYSFWL